MRDPSGRLRANEVRRSVHQRTVFMESSRDGEGKFVASTHALKKGVTASAIGHTADEAKRLLEDKLKIMLETGGVSLVLTAMTPLEDHKCSLLRPVGN